MGVGMNKRKLYDIEFGFEHKGETRWLKDVSFQSMQKSYALGAWSMLKAHYNQNRKHRLMCDGEIIDECGFNKVTVNSNEQK